MKKIVPFTLIFMVLSIVFGILSCTSPAVQHTENAKALYFEDKYDEAIAECNKAIELDSKYTEAYFFRGMSYFGEKKFDLAIVDLDKAIDLDPKVADFYGAGGMALEVLGRHEEAMEYYNNALQLDPINDIAKERKDSLLARGVPDKGPSIPKTGHVYTLNVKGPVEVLHVTEDEAFSATISVSQGLPPYHWYLVEPGASAQNVYLNPNDERGETVEVTGVGAFVGYSSVPAGVSHRLGWVVYEVKDSSEPAKWGRGVLAVDVTPIDQEKIAAEVARSWMESQRENFNQALQPLLPAGVSGNLNLNASKPSRLGENSYSVVVTATITATSFGVRVNVSADNNLRIDTKQKKVVDVQQVGEPRIF